MRRRLLATLAVVLAVGVTTTAGAAPAGRTARHTTGCRTTMCDARVGRAWWVRHHPRPVLPWGTEASWYDDAGGTACGTHYRLGVASHYEGQPDWAGLPCGTRLRVCLDRRCITVFVQDRGPYIAGRELDLNPGARDALGCSGTCDVRYGIAR